MMKAKKRDLESQERRASKRKLLAGRKARGCPKSHSMLKCCGKKDYRDKQQALPVLQSVLSQVMFSTMDAYPCRHHGVWHLGHDRRMTDEEAVFRSSMRLWVSGSKGRVGHDRWEAA